jgi:regulator of nucleoside diphosphate kinase
MDRARLPDIALTARDLSRLDLLTGRVPIYRSSEMTMLARELRRAKVVPLAAMPASTVTMGSIVRYRENDTGQILTATLVYPGEDGYADGRISVLSPEGCALLGLSEGQSISYVTRDGRATSLVVLRVLFQPEAQGLERP